jgi:hypothetical protein
MSYPDRVAVTIRDLDDELESHCRMGDDGCPHDPPAGWPTLWRSIRKKERKHGNNEVTGEVSCR